MRSYIITSTEFQGGIHISYEDGQLRKFELQATLTDAQLRYLYGKFPLEEVQLSVFKTKTSKVTEVTDLSFALFWDEYGHKVGNKDRAKKLWEALPDADKLKAL